MFEPRPTGNEARRRSAIGMAFIILIAGALWLFALRRPSGPAPVPARPPVQALPER